jgi:hypothetical protein
MGRYRRLANCESGGQPPHSKRQDLCAYPRTGPLYTMSAMTRFTIAVFLHLVGMVGLFFGYGLEWVASSLLRRSTNAEEVRAWLRIYRLSLPISGPGLLLLILSGGYFASITERCACCVLCCPRGIPRFRKLGARVSTIP